MAVNRVTEDGYFVGGVVAKEQRHCEAARREVAKELANCSGLAGGVKKEIRVAE
jgi:hypothetical protein